jgi:hypothetical protein
MVDGANSALPLIQMSAPERARFATALRQINHASLAPSRLGAGADDEQIPDRAEVALEYPDKFYSGTFERSSRFEAAFDKAGVGLVLERPGDPEVRKSVHLHVNYGLLADIVAQLSATAGRIPVDEPHREVLIEQLAALHRAVSAG